MYDIIWKMISEGKRISLAPGFDGSRIGGRYLEGGSWGIALSSFSLPMLESLKGIDISTFQLL